MKLLLVYKPLRHAHTAVKLSQNSMLSGCGQLKACWPARYWTNPFCMNFSLRISPLGPSGWSKLAVKLCTMQGNNCHCWLGIWSACWLMYHAGQQMSLLAGHLICMVTDVPCRVTTVTAGCIRCDLCIKAEIDRLADHPESRLHS